MEKRKYGIDILKIIATLFVVVLHVNGYVLDTHVSFSESVNFIWHMFEALAYPAIHIFIMITAWFALDKVNIKKSVLNAWIQTFIICIIGLIFSTCFKITYGLNEIIICIFPFLGRAYWYVTDFIVLIVIAPFLNNSIKASTDKQLKLITLFTFMIISVFQTFIPFFSWTQDYSNIGLFILLYFITACIKRDISIVKRIRGYKLFFVSFVLLILSYEIFHIAGLLNFEVFKSREMWFYQYSSPLVIFEALGLFKMFVNMDIQTNEVNSKIIKIMSNASLTTYLIHMHPIFKSHYVDWGILKFVDIQNMLIYIIEMLLLVVIIFVIGIIFSIPIIAIIKRILNRSKGEYNV